MSDDNTVLSSKGFEDDVYASADLGTSLPKALFPGNEKDPRHAYAAIKDELMLDGNSRQNLATFCQTWEEPELHQLMDDCIDKVGWRGDLQLATFHPQYQFAGEDPHGPTHFTNRSPFPMLHLLLEDQVETAIHTHPNTKLIPNRNKEQMEELGVPYLSAQLMRWQNLS